jgi:GTPase
MPFATLDTRTRKWRLGDGRVVLLSDTVGFIQRLPHHLVASFHATLEEALNVDMLLHVVDASHPDALQQMAAVEQTLAGLTSREADVIALNKIDQVVDPIRLHLLREGREQVFVHVSAVTGEGLDRLERVVIERLDARSSLIEVSVPVTDGRSIAALRAAGVILSERVDDDLILVLRLRLPDGAIGSLRRTLDRQLPFVVVEPAVEPYFRDEQPA